MAAASPWLFHPCMNRLTSTEDGWLAERDLRLVGWVAEHVELPGSILIENASWRWSAGGVAVPVPTGRHALASWHRGDSSTTGIAIDAYGDSTGTPGGWPRPPDGTDPPPVHRFRLEAEQAIMALRTAMPDCACWVDAVTRVIGAVPADEWNWASGSSPDRPGFVQIAGPNGPVAVLEGVIHESAHQHFMLAEASAAMVVAGHGGLYPSPLRADPRPLRNVLLATHALHHVVAFYTEALGAGLLGGEWTDRRDRLARQLAAGVETVAGAESHLTPTGLRVLTSLGS